jgi:hypothetical protein
VNKNYFLVNNDSLINKNSIYKIIILVYLSRSPVHKKTLASNPRSGRIAIRQQYQYIVYMQNRLSIYSVITPGLQGNSFIKLKTAVLALN